ncbi:MAG TPA: hypothetical protein GX727_01265 [Clostridium sp.]|jgi:hypothetical protein|nr:hypothetical protein [Clostridium sp.]
MKICEIFVKKIEIILYPFAIDKRHTFFYNVIVAENKIFGEMAELV